MQFEARGVGNEGLLQSHQMIKLSLAPGSMGHPESLWWITRHSPLLFPQSAIVPCPPCICSEIYPGPLGPGPSNNFSTKCGKLLSTQCASARSCMKLITIVDFYND